MHVRKNTNIYIYIFFYFLYNFSLKHFSFYRGADNSLARPGRKQTTATEDFDVHISYLLSSSSSSVSATTLGGFWPALRFRSTIFYLYTSLSSFSLSSSLNPLLLGLAISVLVFLLVLMNMVPIQLIF